MIDDESQARAIDVAEVLENEIIHVLSVLQLFVGDAGEKKHSDTRTHTTRERRSQDVCVPV